MINTRQCCEANYRKDAGGQSDRYKYNYEFILVLIEPEKLISSAQIVPNNYTFTEIYHIMLAKDLSNPPAADHQDTTEHEV